MWFLQWVRGTPGEGNFRLFNAFENKDVDACLEMIAEIISIKFKNIKNCLMQ
jgi:hypothetical protein